MQSQDLAQASTKATDVFLEKDDQEAGVEGSSEVHEEPLVTWGWLRGLTPFWHDRVIEVGLILSLGLYYLVGNTQLGAGSILHIPPYVYSFPFLAIFACLSWYRLPFAVALLPLALPYYYTQKTVLSYGTHELNFGLGEISLAVCALVAAGQALFYGPRWRYRLSWTELRQRLGPFSIPILIFATAAFVSIIVAVERSTALRAFREEVFDPLIYLVLVLCCLRTRQDVQRLVGAFFGSAFLIAIIGLFQYVLVPIHPQQLSDGNRAHAVYGSANSIGLFFDYILPFGMALLVWQVGQALHLPKRWWLCALIVLVGVPLVGVLVLSQSLGTALALPIALLFILALSVRRRRTLWLGAGILLVGGLVVALVLHKPLTNFIEHWHDNGQGISTVTKRYYLWLTAWHMIGDHTVFGVGMDNWLCYYSLNNVCQASHVINTQYWIRVIPGTLFPTGLRDEPTLSHPHDIFLQIWVSIGIFGLLAFLGILAVFSWLFARLVKAVRRSSQEHVRALEWLVLGVGGAMVAALCQGLIDSSFLEQDLAFCFWALVAILLLLRVLAGVPWRGREHM